MNPAVYEYLLRAPAFRAFERDCASGGLTHAYIVYCRDGFTARALAVLYAAALLCGRGGAPCLECPACRRILAGVHPDCVVYPKTGEKLHVEDIDDLVANNFYRPAEGEYKAFLLQYGGTLSPQAQNKLLKTLEEPCDSTKIILATDNISLLLPTVLSRAKLIESPSFPAADIRALLQEIYPAKEKAVLDETAAAARGNLGEAVRVAEDDKYLKNYRCVYELHSRVKNVQDIPAYATEALSLKDTAFTLEALQAYFRDCMLRAAGAEARYSFGRIAGALPEKTADSYIKLIEGVSLAKRKISLNCNPQAVLEVLLADYAAAK